MLFYEQGKRKRGIAASKISVIVCNGFCNGFALYPYYQHLPSKGYKKDVAPETPDFIGGFAVSTAEKTASDFVDVKKILFPF